jgi:hypothetical protein
LDPSKGDGWCVNIVATGKCGRGLIAGIQSKAGRRKALSRREARIFASLTEVFCAPAPPLPAVGETDAVAFVDYLVARAPRRNRIGFKLILRLFDVAPLLRGYGASFTRLSLSRRTAFVRDLDHSRWMLLRVGARLMKTIALMSYWGDAGVLRASGYDPDAIIARGRALRREEGRP